MSGELTSIRTLTVPACGSTDDRSTDAVNELLVTGTPAEAK